MFITDEYSLVELRDAAVSLVPRYRRIEKISEDEISSFIRRYAEIDSLRTYFLRSKNRDYFDHLNSGIINTFIDLNRINDVDGLNKYLRNVNSVLSTANIFICCVETIEQRKEKLFEKYPTAAFYLINTIDFILHRIFSKMFLTRKLYSGFTRGKNRAISLPEMLGRLVYCGFRILSHRQINGLTYIAAEKEKEPVKAPPPSQGLILRINRVGKNGKLIKIYKLRTMYIFSEYLQQYVYENNSLKRNGKFNNDFRITGWGKFMRKYWLDELPMLINWIKGEVKIVGFRPLTEHYLSLYQENFTSKRRHIKPGMIPPFYYDMPETFEEIMKSEERYVDSYLEKPHTTDLRYFLYALFNIFFKGARSS